MDNSPHALASSVALVSKILFAISLILPAIYAGSLKYLGIELVLLGWIGVFEGNVAWLATPLLICSYALNENSQKKVRLGCAVAAFVLACSIFLYSDIPHMFDAPRIVYGYGPGLYSLLASMLMAIAAAVIAYADNFRAIMKFLLHYGFFLYWLLFSMLIIGNGHPISHYQHPAFSWQPTIVALSIVLFSTISCYMLLATHSLNWWRIVAAFSIACVMFVLLKANGLMFVAASHFNPYRLAKINSALILFSKSTIGCVFLFGVAYAREQLQRRRSFSHKG